MFCAPCRDRRLMYATTDASAYIMPQGLSVFLPHMVSMGGGNGKAKALRIQLPHPKDWRRHLWCWTSSLS